MVDPDVDDDDALAGEYVLGTLDPAERAAVAARRQREGALDAAIAAWEARLAPLMDEVAPVAPPDHLLDGIMRRIDAAGSGETVALRRRLRSWRTAALGACAVAASLLVFVAARTLAPPRPGQSFVAVLQRDAASPAFIVSVDTAALSLTIRPVAAAPQTGRSYELWLVNKGLRTPRSLGVVQNAAFTVASSRLAGISPNIIRDSTFAVTLEPLGGSPSGLPTGPILYSGTLLQATP
jgi:anti-sigma-K factor RskA